MESLYTNIMKTKKNKMENTKELILESQLEESRMSNSNFINNLVKEIHTKNVEAGWWNDPETGETLLNNRFTPYVIATKILMTVTELAEATEGYRKDLIDDKLTDRPMFEVELADALIRILDIAGDMKYDLGGAMEAKRSFNFRRDDHKIENRLK